MESPFPFPKILLANLQYQVECLFLNWDRFRLRFHVLPAFDPAPRGQPQRAQVLVPHQHDMWLGFRQQWFFIPFNASEWSSQEILSCRKCWTYFFAGYPGAWQTASRQNIKNICGNLEHEWTGSSKTSIRISATWQHKICSRSSGDRHTGRSMLEIGNLKEWLLSIYFFRKRSQRKQNGRFDSKILLDHHMSCFILHRWELYTCPFLSGETWFGIAVFQRMIALAPGKIEGFFIKKLLSI